MQPDLNGCCTMLLKSQVNSYNFIVMVQNHLKTRKLIIKSYIKPVKIKWNSCFYFRFYVFKRNTCCKTKRCQLPSILRTLSLQSSRPSSISSPPYMLIYPPGWTGGPFNPPPLCFFQPLQIAFYFSLDSSSSPTSSSPKL